MNNIDICINYILKIDASYLCIDDKIAFFSSYTGFDKDAKWHLITIDEMRRIITHRVQEVNNKDIISAFQEVGRVYDTAVLSEGDVPNNILNYAAKIPKTIEERIIQAMFMSIIHLDINYLTAVNYNKILNNINYDKGIPTTNNRVRWIKKYALKYSYTLRCGVDRMNVKGLKLTILLNDSYKGKVSNLKEDTIKLIIKQIGVLL